MATKFSTLLTLVALLAGANASAASLNIATATPNVTVGQTVTFSVTGSGFTDLTNGGDFSISWNPVALQFVGPVVLAPTPASNPFPSRELGFDTLSVTTASAAQGTLTRLDVFKASQSCDPITDTSAICQANPSGAIGPDLNIVNVSFLVLSGLLGLPNQTAIVSLGADQTQFALGWFKPDASTNYALTYGNASLQVVPAPPAIWLLATAVGGLAARRFRQKAAA